MEDSPLQEFTMNTRSVVCNNVIPYSAFLERRRRQGLPSKKAARQSAKTPCILYPNPNGITVEDIVVDVIRF
jgi:hypothetical protein